MEITLTKDLQRYLGQKVKEGGYADASEVVRDALRDLRAKEDPAERDSQELAELLLPAIRGSHKQVTTKDVDRLRKRAERLVHGARDLPRRLLETPFDE